MSEDAVKEAFAQCLRVAKSKDEEIAVLRLLDAMNARVNLERERVRGALERLTRFVPSLEEDENGEVEAATIRPHDNGDILRRKDVLDNLEEADERQG